MSVTAPVRLPPWLKVKLPSGESFERIKGMLHDRKLNTVCEEARCPNIAECWGGGTATFMVLGDTCTRGCRFCSVATAVNPGAVNPDEPRHLADSLADMGLEYAVLTMVCRDDLPDQGAAHVAECIRRVKSRGPEMLVEMLIGDFRGDRALLKTVLDSNPDVLSHNVETVERLTPRVRDAKAGYRMSLDVLAASKALRPDIHTKSSVMLGLGENEFELLQTFRDLRSVGVDVLTIGQYLRPAGVGRNLPVAEFVAPERFDSLKDVAEDMGFLYVASGPFVRSSYRAAELYVKGLIAKRQSSPGLRPSSPFQGEGRIEETLPRVGSPFLPLPNRERVG